VSEISFFNVLSICNFGTIVTNATTEQIVEKVENELDDFSDIFFGTVGRKDQQESTASKVVRKHLKK